MGTELFARGRAAREWNNPFTTNCAVIQEWDYTITPLHALTAWTGTNLLFILTFAIYSTVNWIVKMKIMGGLAALKSFQSVQNTESIDWPEGLLNKQFTIL